MSKPTTTADELSGLGLYTLDDGAVLQRGDCCVWNDQWIVYQGSTEPQYTRGDLVWCRRIDMQPEPQPQGDPNDPSDDRYWRWLQVGEWVEPTDMWQYLPGKWRGNASLGAQCVTANYYRRRIQQEPEPSQPQQPNDSETVERLRQQLAADAALQQKRRALAERADSVLGLLRLNGVEIVELQHGDIVYRIVRDEWAECQKAIVRRIKEEVKN